MRPPESFSTTAAKFLAHVSGMSWMVGVEIFITMGCCACTAPSGSANDETSAPAARVNGLRISRFMPRMLFPPSEAARWREICYFLYGLRHPISVGIRREKPTLTLVDRRACCNAHAQERGQWGLLPRL